jgi:hypothetical protein
LDILSLDALASNLLKFHRLAALLVGKSEIPQNLRKAQTQSALPVCGNQPSFESLAAATILGRGCGIALS